MPALNFQERFAGMVERGEKRQTIRRVRKYPIKKGDTLFLKVHQRTSHCRALRTEKCRHVWPIKLYEDGIIAYSSLGFIHGRGELCDEMAQDDGFRDWPAMRDWFRDRYGLPFEGVLIEW